MLLDWLKFDCSLFLFDMLKKTMTLVSVNGDKN